MSLTISWISLAITILGTSSGQLTYKLFSRKRDIRLLLFAFFCFGLAQIANYIALREIAIGVTYMMMAINYVLILFASSRILNEKINRSQIRAVILIIVGIVLYSAGYLF